MQRAISLCTGEYVKMGVRQVLALMGGGPPLAAWPTRATIVMVPNQMRSSASVRMCPAVKLLLGQGCDALQPDMTIVTPGWLNQVRLGSQSQHSPSSQWFRVPSSSSHSVGS